MITPLRVLLASWALSALGPAQSFAPPGATESFAKDVTAPPADILSGRVGWPEPSATGVDSPLQILALAPRWSRESGSSVEAQVDVDARGPLALALVTDSAQVWRWSLIDPTGIELDVEALVAADRARRALEDAASGLAGASIDRLDLTDAEPGRWTVRARADGPAPRSPGQTWLLARTAGAPRLVVHTSTLATRSDEPIAIVARLAGADGARITGVRGAAALATGDVELVFQDDGASGDGAADDGIFGAWLPRWTSGDVRVRVTLAGRAVDGAPLSRGAQLTFPIVERRLVLTGAAESALCDDGRVRIELAALAAGPQAKVLVAAELWGVDAAGRPLPVCWLARMQEPRERDAALALALHLDPRWIELSGARAPFLLRRVRVQDADTLVPQDTADGILLALPALPAGRSPAPASPTLDMLQGPLAAAWRVPPLQPASPVLLNPALILAHGYCSGGSIWPPAHFSQPKLEFQDPNQNRTHDQFALLLRDLGSARSSFGVVAHSQGGMAALHLYTYYVSGLDRAQGPRRIQSVGAPYQGTPLASLGFFACGVNANMTPSGSATWLAGIPSWARAEVWYWTTQNSGSACNVLANFVLGQPNDGTVERERGQLPGAQSMAHVTGWCHTTGMSNPAQYTDAALNAERDAQAAR
ncbi:MAG: hypothetical protein JNK02_16230 [Planctomycetes bacterium]|nr:hypothetical protein [Planctomycetota bacterium]